MQASLLIIDDDKSISTMLYENFIEDYDVQIANSGKEGIEKFTKTTPHAVLLDLRMSDMNGLEVLKKLKAISPSTPVIMLTASGDIETATQALKIGADQFLTKPVDLTALNSIVAKAIEHVRVKEGYWFLRERLGHSKCKPVLSAQNLATVNIMAANPNTNVLITSPTGTGKGVTAELIHNKSIRRNALFVDINCAGFPESLLESELFGYEQEAFTGAKSKKKGLMEIADGGTLFLDEIGDMPLSIQGKILETIETGTFRRVGGTTTTKVNVRIIAATKTNLFELMRNGQFREDLYYRLAVLSMRLLSLKESKKLIPGLAAAFIEKFASKTNKPVQGLTNDALSFLCNYSWPGNIRELQNVIERAVILCKGTHINCRHLPLETHKRIIASHDKRMEVMTLKEAEKRQIISTLKFTSYNKSAAAKLLGINSSTLWRKLKRYGMCPD